MSLKPIANTKELMEVFDSYCCAKTERGIVIINYFVDFGGMCYVYVSILILVYYFMLSILPYSSI